MKTITVDLEVFLGYSCSGAWNGDEQTVHMEVEDNIAATLQSMLENAEPDEDGEIYINEDDLMTAIDNGHPELEPLCVKLVGRCHEMEVLYWCDEAYDCIDETLGEYFYEDVKNGLYEPEDDEDFDPEDGYHSGSYEACRENYQAWVRSHTDDPYFMAERLGVDPEACDCDYSFRIKEIK